MPEITSICHVKFGAFPSECGPNPEPRPKAPMFGTSSYQPVFEGAPLCGFKRETSRNTEPFWGIQPKKGHTPISPRLKLAVGQMG